MTNKRLRTNFDTASTVINEAGLTATQTEAVMRKVLSSLPTVAQVMRNFALNKGNDNDK